MQILREVSPAVENLVLRRQEIVIALQEKGFLPGGSLTLKAGESVQTYVGTAPTAVLIEEGFLQYHIQNTPVFLFEEADLVFMNKEMGNTELRCEFATRVRFLRLDEALYVHQEKNFFSLLYALFMIEISLREHILVELFGSEGGLQPLVRHFQKGEVILQEGAEGTSVFTLADGEAQAFVGKVSVGMIRQNEIFGTLAALTKKPRTATVIAQSSCMVLEVPMEQFLPFLQSRPSSMLQVLEEMAHTIVRLNQVRSASL